jgi:hypothetical protein
MKQKMVAVFVVLVAHLLVFQSAQAFPDRPIKLVVASPAGGPPDVMARLLSDKMAAILGQPVIVENRGGAGGTIGARSVATAEPDGYTLVMGSTSTLLIAPAIYKNAGYHAGTFAPVARVADSTEVLAVHPSVPARSVAELIGVAKSRPDALNYGSAGIGTLPHLEGELLKARAQIEMNHVPYRGGGQALTGLLGGEIQVLFSTLTQMLPPGGSSARIGCDQRSPQQAGAGPSYHGRERVRSVHHHVHISDRRASRHSDRHQAAVERGCDRRTRLGGRPAVIVETGWRGATDLAGSVLTWQRNNNAGPAS